MLLSVHFSFEKSDRVWEKLTNYVRIFWGGVEEGGVGGDAEKCVERKKISKPYQLLKLSECSSFLPHMHGLFMVFVDKYFFFHTILPEHFSSSFCIQRLWLCSCNNGSIVYGHK